MRYAIAALLLAALPASAHITLEVPTSRYSNTPSERNKSCPCGAGAGNRLCDNGVRSDANRDPTRVTTYRPGETIQVLWNETVGHSGRYRIAFDPDGADLDDFNQHILLDVVDPGGGNGNLGNGNGWGVAVTLPNTPCNNCTLQLIQVMNGDTVNEVADPTGKSTYYQCADIVIAAASEGEGEGEGETAEGEGEGEGEGEPAEGEGEGEGEGEPAEGEGEGEPAEGEGEGEGESPSSSCGQSSVGAVVALAAVLLPRRRRRFALRG